MERKNTVLLTVIAVATLLVAVVGATFAYFTATNNGVDSSAGSSEVTTAKTAQVNLTSSTISGSNNVVWPGTMNYIGAKTTAEVKDSDGKPYSGTDTFTITYEVKAKITLNGEQEDGFDFPVKYRLYELENDISSDAGNKAVNCEDVVEDPQGTEIHYTQTCTESEELQAITEGNENLKSGQIVAKTKDTDITWERTIEASSVPKTKYYYLVVEYPDSSGVSQNSDQGKTIKAEIVSITAKSTVKKSA